MNVIDKLIQNYYEINGSFDKIILSDVGEYIKVDNMNLKDYCYRSLGYKAANGISESQMHDLRIRYRVDAADTLGFNTREEAENFLRENKMLPMMVKGVSMRINKKLRKYSDVLGQYLKNTDTIIVSFRGYVLSISKVIQSLKAEPKAVSSNAKELAEQIMKYLAFEETSKKPYVYDGVLYTNEKLTEKSKMTIVTDAISLATGVNHGLPKEILVSPGRIQILSYIDNPMYLSILESAEIHGRSLADELMLSGLHLAELAPIYKELGFIPLVCGNTTVVYAADSDASKMRVGTLTTEDLLKQIGG